MPVLDTHVWLWLISGNVKIKKAGFLPVIYKAVEESSVVIPAICLWEVSMLAAKKRIAISENMLDWFSKALSAPGIRLAPLTPDIAHESANLPGEFHGDPADRLIVATARVLDGVLLTFDKEIIKYAKKGHVRYVNPKGI